MGASPTKLLSKEEISLITNQWKCDLTSEFQDALQFFNQLDFSKDGRLNRNEFSKSLGILGVNNSNLCNFLFDAIDLDSNGSITFFEFFWFMMTLIKPDIEPKFEFAFRLIDLDKNGEITIQEIRTMVETLYTILTNLKLQTTEVDGFVNNLCQKIKVVDGKISRDEWKHYYKQNSKYVKALGIAPKKKKKASDDKASMKLGKAVFFGHTNWDLMLTVMLGIQVVVEKSPRVDSSAFKDSDFSKKESYDLGKGTSLIAYGPQPFRSLRHHFQISEEQFLLSLGIRSVLGSLLLGDLGTLSSLISEGKSGSFFYWSSDGQFMVKTISSSEKETFVKILPEYYSHMRKNPNTLLTKMFGLYKLKTNNDQELRFVVLGNVFLTNKQINYRFDLKGSTVGRTVGEENINKSGVVFKDLDWMNMKRKINILPKYVAPLKRQLQQDVAFLSKNNIIDYSLLVGVHKTGTNVKSEKELWKKENEQSLNEAFNSLMSLDSVKKSHFFDQLDLETFSNFAYKNSSSSLNNDVDTVLPITSPSLFQQDDGGMKSYRVDDDGTEVLGEEVIFVGIIDTLIAYEGRKQAEHLLKSVIHDGTQISVIPPSEYSERFLKFVLSSVEDTETVRASCVSLRVKKPVSRPMPDFNVA